MDEELPPIGGGRINEFGQLENILNQAAQHGLVNDVPKDTASTFDIQSQRIRLQTVSTWLYLLGYLPNKIDPDKIHLKLEEIKVAVLSFQIEAGLEADEWVGNETWYALEELVTFESTFTEDKWFLHGIINVTKIKAVHRAIQLRLWCLGLYKSKPGKNFKLLKYNALEKFKRILDIFLVNYPENFGLNFQSLKLLFDQDLLSRRIAQRSTQDGKRFLLNLSIGDNTNNQELAQCFIVNSAKIELWLLGFKVNIDGKGNFVYDESSDLFRSLVEFHEKFNQNSHQAAILLAQTITPELFKDFTSTYDVTNQFDADDASELISTLLDTTEKISQAWDYVSKKGTSLWDGLQRIWRWIKKMGGKVISLISGNLYKSFFRIASKAYKIVHQGFLKTTESIIIYLDGGFATPSTLVEFKKDLDSQVFLFSGSTEEENLKTIDRIIGQSRAFNLSCNIISLVLDAIKSLFIGIIGWAKLLYCLIKNYSNIKLLYSELKLLSST